MLHIDHAHVRYARIQRFAFAMLAVISAAALLFGLTMIVYANYHERAYIFLILGAAGFIGGIAGFVGEGSKVRAALSYGAIAFGMMGLIIGLNYLTNRYGPSPNQGRGEIVLAMSCIAILAGIAGALFAQPNVSVAALSSVFMLGVIASLGVATLTAGTVYLLVLQSYKHAYLLLGTGTVCLLAGIACGVIAQSKVRTSSH